MIIGNKELVEMFGSEANKITYEKIRKVHTEVKNSMLNKAKKEYKIVEDLGRGKYNIDDKYEHPITIKKENRRDVEYEFVEYEKIYDKLNGVYCIIYENYIYIGSTIVGFRNRHSTYAYNIKNENRKSCLGDKLISLGGKINILWSTESNNEFDIRHKEFEFIEKYESEGLYEVINKTRMVSVSDRKDNRKIKQNGNTYNRKITVKIDDYNKVVNFLKENNIKFV